MMEIEGYTYFAHSHGQFTHLVYVAGEGPPVILMHELPGITPECLAFSQRLQDCGFKVYLPLFHGKPGKPMTFMRNAGKMFRICVSREFRVLATRETSPVINWLRSLCRKVHAEHGGRGVGAIGMCMTGGFAIPMMVEPCLMAPVLAQPALPACFTASCKRSLGVSPDDLAIAVQRAEQGQPLYGFRFSGDKMSPPERFETLRNTFGDQFRYVEIDSSPGNAAGISPKAHSVFTHDYDHREGSPTRNAFELLVQFLDERLR